jgi:protein-S-isoprenylcysteine O-methyltransferase Ste14
MPQMLPQTRSAIVRWSVQSALGMVGYGVLLFGAAGTLSWVWGWAILALVASFLAAHPILLIPINPELLAEREKGSLDRPVKTWDKWTTMLSGLVMIASWVVAGLDVRFGWTGAVALACHLAGLLVMVLGYALFLWAMVSNAFFAEGVRIQEERGHTVATTGPYRYVRHPGYVGSILSQLATPLLLGSPWVAVGSLAFAALFVLRTALEDRTLLADLPGYAEYARQTRYRLVPGLW